MTWNEDRVGKFTASEMWKLFVEPRSKSEKWSQTAKTYIFSKAVEEFTGFRENISSKAIEHGLLNEKDGFDLFKYMTNLDWKFTGKEFFKINDYCGASPDAVYYDNFDIISVADIKCPQPVTFFERRTAWIDGEEINREYFYQLQTQMLATGAESSFLVYYLAKEFVNTYSGDVEFAFDLPVEKRMFFMELKSDKDVHNKILEKVELANEYKKEILSKL